MTHIKPYITTLLLLFLCIGFDLVGQDKAQKLMNQNRFADAVRAYEKHVQKNPEDRKAYEELGTAYRYLRKFEKAETSYERAESLGGLTENGYVNYGQILVKNGKPEEARKQFEQYLKYEPESFVVRLMMQSLREVESWSNVPSSYEIKHLVNINSEYSDFAPVIYKNGIAFATERNEDHVNQNSSGWSNNPYLAVFYAEFEDQHGLEFSRPKNFLSRLYGDYHVGPIAIDTVHQQAFYTEVKSTLKKDEVQHLETYVADIIKGKRLGKPELLPVDADTFSTAHPAITPDGNTLFFCSDKPGGIGDMDIYSITRTDGGWSSPVLLPGQVNTEANEVFPYAKSSTHIYFASNGHTGYGGLDIFESKFENGAWTKPVNLKSPVNSEGDDFGITFYNQNRGYFSSERDGGMGHDDIYQFVKIAEPDDNDRVTVSGVFEYAQLPKEGVKLRLLDEEDNLLEEVWTDSLGNFVFSQLPTNKNFKVEVADASADMLSEASVYLLNEQGEKVSILDRMNESQFAFKTLPQEEFDSMALLDAEDRELGTYEIFGQLYSELPKDNLAGIKLIVVDDEGNIVREATTDNLGLYSLTNLDKSEFYTVKFAGGDSIVRQSSIFFEDNDGIRPISENENSLFHLDRLISARLSAIEKQVPTRGYVEYEGAPLDDVRLMVVDSSDKNMMAARSDSTGYFDFGSLSANQNFNLILPDSISELPGVLNIYLIDRDGKRLVYAKEKAIGRYAFQSLDPIKYSGTALEENDTKLAKYGIYGQVFRKLPGDYHEGLTIVATDSEGRVIETVLADKDGKFNFTKLQPDQQYIFQVAEQDHGSLLVSIFDTDGNLVDKLRIDELAAYVYEKLQSEDASLFQMAALDASSLDDKLVSGMVYKKLPGDYKGGILVYAVDERGNVIDSAFTDAQGNFEFQRLSKEEDFTLKVLDEDDSEMMVGFYNYEGKFDGLISLDETNAFTYSKIILEAASDLGQLETTDGSTGKLYGQVYKKLPGDYEEGMKIYAYDENGVVIDEATLDKEGRFKFEKLSPDASYSIRLANSDDAANLVLLDANGNQISQMDASEGEWKWDKLAHEEYDLALQDVKDSEFDNDKFRTPKPVKPLASGENRVYFEYKSSTLSADDSNMLAAVVNALNADDGRLVHIESHKDGSEVTGQYSYSAMRSVQIVRYLEQKGVNLDKVYVQNWETDKPVVDCPDGTPCSGEDRAKNQRSEVNIVDASELPTEPDHIITFEFNEWLLPDEANNALFGLINLLEANPSYSVVLDGYSDTWGAYGSNERISQLRVINIKNTLLSKNIDENRIKTNWHGESVPFGGCLTEYPCPVDERKQNRRVEIRVIK